MRNFIFCSMLILSITGVAQVGIGTATPSPAAMLEVSSSSDNGFTYKGFMPPRVSGITERDAINPLPADRGLLIFVSDVDCLQLWNGSGWENIHCNNNPEFTPVFQNFDLNTGWGYTTDVPFFDNGAGGFFGVTNTSNGGFASITGLTNDFLGIMDLDDEGNNGTSGFATITFNTVNVISAVSGVTVAFDYAFFEFDAGDDAYYTLIIDGIPQAEVQLINGASNLSLNGSVSRLVPGGTTTIGLSIRIKQNGVDDYAGFDNFSVIAQ